MKIWQVVLVVVAIIIVLQTASAQIPNDMTLNEFKKEVSRANSYGFLSLLSTGTWKTCTSDYPSGTFYPADCNPCSFNEVSSSCSYSCFQEQMSRPCCYSLPSCSLWSCCNARFIDKICYCSIPQTQCSGGADPGAKKCSGGDLWECNSNGVWEFYEDCADGCENAQCVSCTPRYEKKCVGDDVWYYDSCGNKDELKETCSYKCENAQCVSDPCEYITCEDKCQNSVRSYNGYCSNGECVYKTENCDYGCSGKLCAGDLCAGVICEDYCSNSIFYHTGICNTLIGKCEYSEQICTYGCDEDKCATMGCITNDDCEDYCSDDKNTLFYDGKCIAGKCTQFQEKEYAEECMVKPWYENVWIWVGGGMFIIFSVFGILYWRRR